MSAEEELPVGLAAELRREFDGGFAVAVRERAEATVDLLALRVGGAPHAVLLSELAALYADRKVVPVPSAAPELLGLTGVRGALVPVYDLRLLLGLAASGPARWLLLPQSAEPVAFACELVEAHLRVAPSALGAAAQSGAQSFTRGVLRDGTLLRPLLPLASLVEALSQRALRVDPRKDR